MLDWINYIKHPFTLRDYNRLMRKNNRLKKRIRKVERHNQRLTSKITRLRESEYSLYENVTNGIQLMHSHHIKNIFI